ncbi:Peroxide stress-activated histidine kinase mak1 [Colletotrichum tanaceti]|uniref:histidine kinase n=1 Tax=Colletotrichum tanaceti TaxID=1306861 RepID=A0A4U6XSA5_9PEZI|nr:Peroxide stress-activated histidine kinase mak1 [Colletotrichum tanaceti]TKW58793.1 Peroxide stress-activated histidine kinase mak1 [Colletotrichum tanaceti]
MVFTATAQLGPNPSPLRFTYEPTQLAMAFTENKTPNHVSDRSKAELIRQREVFKYASSLLSSMTVPKDDDGPDSLRLRIASDNTTLTAFSQLCAYQTGAARSFISLFDETYHYVVAEATPALPLVPGIPHDDLLFCGDAFPRCFGACESALFQPNGIRGGSSSGLSDIPVVVVPNLGVDAHLNIHSKPCVIGHPEPGRFYASAPIQTAKGINIGIVCVMSPRSIDNWSEAHSQILRNISCSIMRYLEGNRTSTHFRSERMNKGISAFMEESFSLAGSHFVPKAADPTNPFLPGEASDSVSDGSSGRQSASSLSRTPSSDSYSTPTTPASESDGSQSTGSLAPIAKPESPDPTTQPAVISASEAQSETPRKTTNNLIFSNAAEKIRQATDTEGCLFLDATPASFGALRSPLVENPTRPVLDVSSTSSDDGTDSAPGSMRRLPARVLGFSTSEGDGVDGYEHITRHAAVAEKLLGNLVRRYPKGKLFTFHAAHDLNPTDSSEEERLRHLSPLQDSLSPDRSIPGRQRQRPHVKAWARQNEGRDILRIFPGSRSVAFVPVWDPRKNRWYAGGFIYSRQPTRTFTVEGELSYLRVFSILAVSESLRSELILDEKAKFDALSCMSHELRSPLHGIILGVELLTDTDLSAGQRDIVHTLEACGRTLGDTFDHLLDYAKVNNFQTTKRPAYRGIRQGKPHSLEIGMMTLRSNVQIDLLAEEVIDSIFAGFTLQHLSIARLKSQDRTRDPNVTADLYLDSLRAKEDLSLNQASQIAGVAFSDVLVVFDVDPECLWVFDTQPGAIRRIIMNLFGNALKYTRRGIIKVALSQRAPKREGANRERQVTITVSDTGSGIGEDFLHHQLFRPFSQENSLAPGTGLGLSLVKQMASKLRGRMSVQSQVGSGTSISVTLPLSVPPNVPTNEMHPAVDAAFQQQRKELSGLRIRLLGFDCVMTLVNGEKHDSHAKIGDMCRNWLGLEVLPKTPEAHYPVPDFVLASEDALEEWSTDPTLSMLPCVVVSANALVAYHCSKQWSENAGTMEFISQPIGPRKLAKVVLRAFDRWSALQAGRMSPVAESSTSDISQAMIEPKMGRHEPKAQPTSTLTIRSSASDDSGVQVQPTLQGNPAPRPEFLKTPSIRNMAIQFLLVEDNPINLKILSTYMRKLGLGFNTAVNGQEAVDAYKRNPSECRCILTDVSMPVMDGFEATRHIRAYEKASDLAPATIIALTGLASSESQNEAFGSGMDLFLTKPVKLKELGAILKSRGLDG